MLQLLIIGAVVPVPIGWEAWWFS